MTDRGGALFGAIRQSPNLRGELVDKFAAQIEAGDLAPGQRLPTEQEIVNATGVSRTVVREALASLRARGLITTRQGLGAFVAQEPPPKTFSIVPTDIESIDEILAVLELRMGVELEAAALAAMRRTTKDLAVMAKQLDAIDRAIAETGLAATEDAGFHRAISLATHNAYFGRLFDTFGAAMIPRQWTQFDRLEPDERERHFERTRREHRAIYDAIEARDAKVAQRAMRLHLTRSYKRFEQLRDGAEHLK